MINLENKNKLYIIFDLDGTITDSGPGITNSAAYALKSFGIEANPDELRGFIGPPLTQSFMDFYNFDANMAAAGVEKYREYYSVTGIYENAVYDGVETLFKRLVDTGKKIMLATSKPEIFAKQILEHFHLDSYFTFVAGSKMDGRRTDKAELIAYVLEQNQIAPEYAVMVGDRRHDIIGALKTGVDAVGVLYGYGTREELEAAGAVYIAENMQGLADILL